MGLTPSKSTQVVTMAATLASFTGLKNAATFVGAKAEATIKVPAVKAVGTKEVTQAKLKVAINGFGGVKQATHLLKYDSILGTFDADIKITGDDTFSLNGREIKVVSNRDPLKLPWKDLGVDIVIESTGVFIDEEGAGKHITAGAKKVVITAPGKGAIPTYVMGVNADDMTGDEPIVSNASCTTNGMACFVKVLDEKFGIVKGMMTTTHSYTGDQRLLDNSHRDARRARAACLNRCGQGCGPRSARSQGQAERHCPPRAPPQR